MGDALLEAFRYNRWANLHLLDICSSLDEAKLQLTSPGTYGTIGATLQHLLATEQRYVGLLNGSEPRLSEKDEFPGVARLKRHAERSGQDLIDASGQVNPHGSLEGRRARVKNWVVITQAIHHGNDHRTQICTILGQNGVSVEDMDVWAYAETNEGYERC